MTEMNQQPDRDPEAHEPETEPAIAPSATAEKPDAKPRKRRRWPYVVGGLLLLLLLLIASLPWIASTATVKGAVLAQVNQRINGRLEVADWSVSWTGGLKVQGLKLFDDRGAQIVELASATTELKLLDAIRGNFALGKTIVKNASVNFVKYADGSNTFSRLPKTTPAPSAPQPEPQRQSTEPQRQSIEPPAEPAPKAEQPAAPAKPLKVPDFSGDIQLVDCRAHIDQEAAPGIKPYSVNVVRINGSAVVADANAPIDHKLEVVAKVNGGPESTFLSNGSTDVFEKNLLDLATANVTQTAELKPTDLKPLTSLLPPSAGIEELAGTAEATFAFELVNGKAAGLTANVRGKGIDVAGPAFKNKERLQADEIALVVPAGSMLELSAGAENWREWSHRVGSGKGEEITLTMTRAGKSLVDVRLGAQGKVRELLTLAENRQAGGDGFVRAKAVIDVGGLAAAMPQTLRAREGMSINAGTLEAGADVAYTASKATPRIAISLKGVTGTDADQKAVALAPIFITTSLTTQGGGLQMPDLRDVTVLLNARGASANLQGPTIADLKGNLRLSLDVLQAELGQFVNFGTLATRGDVTWDISAVAAAPSAIAPTTAPTTAPASPGGDRVVTSVLTASAIQVNGLPGGKSLRLPHARVEAGARLIADDDGSTVKAIREARLIAVAGEQGRPLVNADVTADLIDIVDRPVEDPKAAKAETVKVAVARKFDFNLNMTDLRQAQADYGSFVAALDNWAVRQGTAMVKGTGGYEGNGARFGLTARLNGMTLDKLNRPAAATQPAAGAAVAAGDAVTASQVLNNYSANLDVAGGYATSSGGTRIVLTTLNGSDNLGLWKFSKTAKEFEVVLPANDAPVRAQGAVELGSNLAGVSEVWRKYSGPAPAAVPGTPVSPTLRTGQLSGTLELAALDAKSISVGGVVNFTGLTVAGAGPVMTNESVNAKFLLSADPDFNTLKVEQFEATGPLIDARVQRGEFALLRGKGKEAKAVPPLQMVRAFSTVVTLPDVAKWQALLDAFAPAGAKPAAAPVAALPDDLQPLNFIGASDGVAARPAWPAFARPVLIQAVAAQYERVGDYRDVPEVARLAFREKVPKLFDLEWYRVTRNGESFYAARYAMTKGGKLDEYRVSAEGRLLAGPVEPGAYANAAPAVAGNPPASAPQPQPSTPPAPGAVAPGDAAAAPAAPKPAEPPGAKAPSASPAAAKPPIKLTQGTLTFKLDATSDAAGLTITPDVSLRALAFTSGPVTHNVGDVAFKAKALIAPADLPAVAPSSEPPPFIKQVREIRIDELSANGIGSMISLKQPIILRDLADLPALFTGTAAPGGKPNTAAVNAHVLAKGDLVPMLALMDAMGGVKPQNRYAGTYEVDQKLSTANGAVRADGGAVVRDFVARDEKGADAFREQVVRLVNVFSIDGRNSALTFENVSLAMESSKALSMDVKGQISDLMNARAFEGDGLQLKTTYDASKLVPFIQAVMKPVPDPKTGKTPKDRYAGMKMAGSYTKTFTVKGSYPAAPTAGRTAAQSIVADGAFTLDSLEMPGFGLTMGKADLAFAMADGIGKLSAPVPIPCNEGQINLANAAGSFVLDMTGPHPRLSGPADLKLFENVSLNPVLSDFLGGAINNPLFVESDKAAGKVNLTMVELTRLPVDTRVLDYDPTNDGRAEFEASIARVQIGNPLLVKIQSAVQSGLSSIGGLDNKKNWLESFEGDIKSYRIKIEKGITSHDMVLALGEQDRPLRLYGNVRMQDRALLPLTLNLPPGLFNSKDVAKFIPNGFELPFTGSLTGGTTSGVRFDVAGALQHNVVSRLTGNGDPAAAIGNIFEQIQKRNDPKSPAAPGTQPAEPRPQDPIGGLIGDLLNKNQKDKEEKERKEREKKEREKKKREQQQ